MSDDTIPASIEQQADELTTEAEDRWGDEWFLKVYVDADGDGQAWAIHTVEVVADGVAIRDILTHTTGGQIVKHRSLYDLEEVVADVGGDAEL